MNFEVFFSLLKNNWKTNLSNLNFFAVLFESFVNDDCLNELQYKIENYDHSDVKKIIEKRGPSKDLVSFALDNKDEIKFIDILSENLVDINFIQNKLEEENFDFYTRDGDIDCFQTIYDLFVKLLRNILKRIKTVEPPIYKKNYNFFRDLYDKKMTYNDHLFHIEKHTIPLKDHSYSIKRELLTNNLYEKKLFEIYSEECKFQVDESNIENNKYKSHFNVQKTNYISYLHKKRQLRDIFNDVDEYFNKFEDNVYLICCININIYKDNSPFLKYNSICDSVINATYNLSICNITNLITIGEKIGAMHELVNIEKIKGWINNE